jgi:hypothetical protein
MVRTYNPIVNEAIELTNTDQFTMHLLWKWVVFDLKYVTQKHGGNAHAQAKNRNSVNQMKRAQCLHCVHKLDTCLDCFFNWVSFDLAT